MLSWILFSKFLKKNLFNLFLYYPSFEFFSMIFGLQTTLILYIIVFKSVMFVYSYNNNRNSWIAQALVILSSMLHVGVSSFYIYFAVFCSLDRLLSRPFSPKKSVVRGPNRHRHIHRQKSFVNQVCSSGLNPSLHRFIDVCTHSHKKENVEEVIVASGVTEMKTCLLLCSDV